MMATAQRVLNYLLVEDNADHADIIEQFLSEADDPPHVERVASGTDCLSYLEGDGEYADRSTFPFPHVVLLDIRMPGVLDGLQTLQAIRSDPNNRRLHVVMLTTSDRDADIDRAYELGANEYIVKGDNPATLFDKLSTLHRSMLSTVELARHDRRGKEEPSISEDRLKAVLDDAGESELLHLLMQADCPTGYELLARQYRSDPHTALQALLALSQVIPGRFAKLAFMLAQRERKLIAGGDEVDWDYLQQIVMNRLPDVTSQNEFAGLVAQLEAVLDKNGSVDRQSAQWHTWQGFQQACLARVGPALTVGGTNAEQAADSQAEEMATAWRAAAVVATSLLILSILWYLFDKFILTGL